MFKAPIPGMSLTGTPGNAPWEQPPKTHDIEEAVRLHITKMNKPKTLDSIINMLELGYPVKAMTESILTGAVMHGIHTVDVSVIIAPVIHAQLVAIAKEAGIEYDEGFDEPTEEKEARERELIKAKVRAKMRKMGKAPQETKDFMSQAIETLDVPESQYTTEEAGEMPMEDTMQEESSEMPMETEMQQPQPRGLMARRM